MRKKFMFLSIIFVIVFIILPFLIDFLYKMGMYYPIILVSYSKSEILTYIISIIGISIGMTALFISLLQNEPNIRISRSRRIIEGPSKFIECIEISNECAIPFNIINVGMISQHKRNKRKLMYTFSPNSIGSPFTIQAYSKQVISFGSDELYEKIAIFKHILVKEGYKTKKVIYYVALESGNTIEHESKIDKIYLNFKEEK